MVSNKILFLPHQTQSKKRYNNGKFKETKQGSIHSLLSNVDYWFYLHDDGWRCSRWREHRRMPGMCRCGLGMCGVRQGHPQEIRHTHRQHKVTWTARKRQRRRPSAEPAGGTRSKTTTPSHTSKPLGRDYKVWHAMIARHNRIGRVGSEEPSCIRRFDSAHGSSSSDTLGKVGAMQ